MNELCKTYGIQLGRKTSFGDVSVEISVKLTPGAEFSPDHPMHALKEALRKVLADFPDTSVRAEKADS